MRILLIEDDLELSISIKKALERVGYGVDISGNGIDGVAAGHSGTYDLIILDWLLPDISGTDICIALRKANISAPILFLSALSDVKYRVIGLDSGADDYMTKPFGLLELLARIRALSRREPKLQPNILRVQDLTLNLNSRAVMRGSNVIFLSAKEFALLSLFMSQPGHIFSSEALLVRIWSDDCDTLLSTVTTSISHLRAKIDKPFNDRRSLIQTSWGQGYFIK